MHVPIYLSAVFNNNTYLCLHRPSDEGIYRCEVFNKHGNESREFNVSTQPLMVAYKPMIKNGQPANATVVVGENVTLKCELVMDDPSSPVEVTW